MENNNGEVWAYKAGGAVWTYKDGYLHNEDGPAIIHSNGDKEWWFNNQRHRTDGPAVIRNSGRQEWWVNGRRHRTDGPAIINRHRNDGRDKVITWYANGYNITKLVDNWMNERGYCWSIDNPWDDDIKAEFLLTFTKY